MATNLQVQSNISSTAQLVQDASSNNSSLSISSDKIGIGQTSPAEKLEVDGNIKLTDYTNDRVWATEKVFNVLDYGAIPLSLRSGCLGTSGEIVASTNRITESGKFVNASVGDILWVHSGINTGYYEISSIISSDTVQVSSTAPLHGFYDDQSDVSWKVTSTTGAASDADSTGVFDDAIEAANLAGGGVVLVPTGYYFFTSNLTISENVILQGMWSAPHNWRKELWEECTPQGPVLLPTAGRGSSTGDAFITLDGASSARNAVLEGLTIFYPEQRITGGSTTINVTVVEFPFCIELDSGRMSDNTVRNMLLVNPYQGINVTSTAFEGRCRISNISGGPLFRGIVVDGLFDVSYIEDILFTPYYLYGWYDGSQEGKDWNTFIVKNLIAVQIKGSIWAVLKNVFAFLSSRGLVIETSGTPKNAGDIIGQNIQFDQADVPLEMKDGSLMLTNFKCSAGRGASMGNIVNNAAVWATKTAILAGSNGKYPLLKITNGNLRTYGSRMVDIQTPGYFDISNTIFCDNPEAQITDGVYASNGRISIQDCRFGSGPYGFAKCINTTSNVTSVIVSGNDYINNLPGTFPPNEIFGNTEISDLNDVSTAEGLTDGGFPSATNWAVTNGFNISSGKAVYTYNVSMGTLVQPQANLAIPATGNKWYKFTYTVSDVTDGDPDTPLFAIITTAFAAENVSLGLKNGTHTLYFKTASSPGNFVITAGNGQSGDTFKLDDVSLKEINGGDLIITGSVGIGTTNPGAKLDVKGNAMVRGPAWGAGNEGVVALGDANNYIKAVYAEGVRIGVYNGSGSEDAICLKQGYSVSVGIGTTSPTAKLDVNPGTISDSNPNIRLRGATSTAPSGGNDGDIQVYSSGATKRLYIKIASAWYYVNLTAA